MAIDELLRFAVGSGTRKPRVVPLPVSDNPTCDDGLPRWYVSLQPMTASERIAYLTTALGTFAARETAQQQWSVERDTIVAFRLPLGDESGAIMMACYNCEPPPGEEQVRKIADPGPFLESAAPELIRWLRERIDEVNGLSDELLREAGRLRELARKSGILPGEEL